MANQKYHYKANQSQFGIDGIDFAYNSLPNYKVIFRPKSASNKCIIFFSGNGIYFPNSVEEFRKRIIIQNRFEWESLCSNIKGPKKLIFVRDIYKTWYAKGINSEINSIKKVIEFLRVESIGYDEIICIGNSAGGYASVLFGSEIGATAIFSISGYFNISSEALNPENQFLFGSRDAKELSMYFNLAPYCSLNATAPIFYFCPVGSLIDRQQFKASKTIPNVHAILLSSKIHGQGLESFLYSRIMSNKSQEKFRYLAATFPKKIWSKQQLSLELVGCSIRYAMIVLSFIKKMSTQAFRKFYTYWQVFKSQYTREKS